MLFNSLQFALFFPLACGLYFLSPTRWRTALLLAASCYFYMAFIPAYILILFVTIIIDYTAGLYLETGSRKKRKAVLWVSIVATCVVLFVFKYFYFFTHAFVDFANLSGWQLTDPALRIILPIGLSFHTFQSLSYVIEVYHRRQSAERNFIVYATYVMFFPQLVAGPIERPQNLLHQFREPHAFDYERVCSGLRRMGWGFFKKLVVADRLALYVNDVYGSPSSHNGLQLTLATFFFAYQIYCDFSGYSDIAIGSARVLGFSLMENFNSPYHSRSVAEFWRRWHISLSTWFRDYVYVPLGGSRVRRVRWMFNVAVTFAISGLWHGANWTYVVWGLLNGLYLITGAITSSWRSKFFARLGLSEANPFRAFMRVSATFSLICVAWVVFRANSLSDAGYLFSHFLRDRDFRQVSTAQFLLRQMPVAVGSILLLEVGERLLSTRSILPRFAALPGVVRWPVYSALVLGVVLFGVFQQSQFIYFQF